MTRFAAAFALAEPFGENAQVMAADSRLGDRVPPWFGAAPGRPCARRILDVGGTPEIWGLLAVPETTRVVLLNMPRADESRESAEAGLEYVHGDGCRLPFADESFDIVFSNSVIEHVGGVEAQRQFAREIMRTGRGYWVQTPNRYFPVETHLLTPLVHLLPRPWKAFIARRFTVWQWVRRPGAEEKRFYIEHFVSDIRLLGARDMQRLFPDAVILRERFLGFTKSVIAYRAEKRPQIARINTDKKNL